MATINGYNGVLKVGATPATTGEIKSFNLEISADVVETSTLGSAWATNKTTLKRWSGSAQAHFDISDSGQDEFRSAILAGSTIACEFYLGGTTSGNTKYAGNAVVASSSIANDVGGIVTVDFSLTGTGALTETVIS